MKTPTAFSGADMQALYAKIAQARAQADASAPADETEQEAAPIDPAKAERADLFARRYAILRKALPWVSQPKACSISSYVCECPDQEKAVRVCQRFADRLLDRVLDGRAATGILLVGKPGTGKTHLARGILCNLAAQGAPGFFIPATEFFDLYTPSFGAQLDVPLWKVRELLSGISCLVLDDVGTSAWTDARRDRLQQVLDSRIAAGLPTVITTNLGKQDFADENASRISSRMSQYLFPLACKWTDWREKTAAKRFSPEELF